MWLDGGALAEWISRPTWWRVGCLLGSWEPAGMDTEAICRSGGDCCSGLQNMTVEYQGRAERESVCVEFYVTWWHLNSVMSSRSIWQCICMYINNIATQDGPMSQRLVRGWCPCLECLHESYIPELKPPVVHIHTYLHTLTCADTLLLLSTWKQWQEVH